MFTTATEKRTRPHSRKRSREHMSLWLQVLTNVKKTILHNVWGAYWAWFHVKQTVSTAERKWNTIIVSNVNVGSLSHIVYCVIFFLFDLDSASIKDNRNQWKLDQAMVDSRVLLAPNFLLHLQLPSFVYWMFPCHFVI